MGQPVLKRNPRRMPGVRGEGMKCSLAAYLDAVAATGAATHRGAGTRDHLDPQRATLPVHVISGTVRAAQRIQVALFGTGSGSAETGQFKDDPGTGLHFRQGKRQGLTAGLDAYIG